MSIIHCLLVTQCAFVVFAQHIQPRPLSETESQEVREKLGAFDMGNITLDSLTTNTDGAMKLIEYYLSPTNGVTTKMKLPISKSFAIWGQYPQAAELAQDYVKVYSNDWRGWRVLGGSEVMMKNYDVATKALLKAEQFGDEKNDLALGIAALAVNRLDILEKVVVPHLLVQIYDGAKFPEKQRIQMRGCLIAYALKTDKEDIFIKAVVGVDLSKISEWSELKDQIALGCRVFKGPDIDTIRQELNAATTDNPNSGTTNK
jgi:hypothetical protein